MKLKNKITTLLLAATALTTACTDSFEEVNSDPNKIYTVTFQSIFPGTVYRTMNVISELNAQRMLSYSRYAVIAYAQTAWQGTDGIYREFYVDIMRDLRALEKQYESDDSNRNTYATILTWKSLVYYQMLSLYGPVILSDANFEDTSKKQFNYDDEADAYETLLKMLTTAYDMYDVEKGGMLTKDPVYDGDISKWKKLTNTLRLEIAMNVQNISTDMAQQYATLSMNNENDIFATQDEQLAIQYGTVDGSDGSYYYTFWYKNQIQTQDNWGNIPSLGEYFATYLFSFKDPRLQTYFRPSGDIRPGCAPYLMPDILTRLHDCDVSNCNATDRALHLQWMIEGKEVRDSLRVRYNIPYVPTADGPGSRTPFGWERMYDPTDPNGNLRVDDPLNTTVDNKCYIQAKYYDIDAVLPILRLTDARFLCAEAKVKFNLGSKSAETYYNEGVTASFEENGLPADSLNKYMAQDGVKWGTSHTGFDDTRRLFTAKIDGANGVEGKLDQIYKQRYFAGFMDGLGAWRLERRTRNLNFPPLFLNGGQAYEEGGDPYYLYPERLVFTDAERQTNRTAYDAAVANLQAKSPEGNEGRWGDNIFTLLQFAKRIPNKAETIAWYRSLHYIDFNMDMQAKYYGKTWEDFLRVARRTVSYTANDTDLDILKRAFQMEVRSTICTYVVE